MLRRFFKEGSPSPEAVYIAMFVAIGIVLIVVLRLVAFPSGANAGGGKAPPGGPAILGAASPSAPAAAAAGGIPVGAGYPPAAPPSALATAPPIRVEIPAIRVSSSLLRLGLNRDHTMEVPTDFQRAGWYQGSAIPGNPGPTVIVGHVDSYNGPAVFYAVRNLKSGDRVTVWRSDGVKVNYVIQRLMEVPKNRFPTRLVYGQTPVSTIRLITCGGPFNRATGHYQDNIIAFGTLS